MKTSSYINLIPFDGGVLVHNCLYNTALKVYSEKCKKKLDSYIKNDSFPFDESDPFQCDLKKLNMIIDEDTDEPAIVNYMYEKRSRTLNLFLIVTRMCNFRCPYCVQDHSEKIMKWETYLDAKSFFLNKIQTEQYDRIIVNFFGGEPLLETENIIRFMTELRSEYKYSDKNNKDIMGHVTSNGYLLTPENFERLVNAGVDHFQITLDGLAETHNKSRYLANHHGTWDTIVSNLVAAKNTDLNFQIQMRTNYTQKIIENMDQYLDFYSENFGDDNRFKLYFEAAKDYGTLKETDDLGILVNEAMSNQDIIRLVKEKNIKGHHLAYQSYALPLGAACYSSNTLEWLIDFDGTIRKCTFDLDSDDNYAGKLNQNGAIVELDRFSSWTSYDTKEKCKQCSIYPVCYGRKCPISYHKSLQSDNFNATISSYCDTIHSLYNLALETTYLF